MSRRVFRLDPAHPVIAGLDDDNLRDWAASGTLLEPKPNYNVVAQFDFPRFGWRWGSRGTVTSAALEKPHYSGWRPLLECEFDLAYSPLMELDYLGGRITLCTLDLEDQASADPAAEKIARQLINHAATAPLARARPAKTLFVGPAASYGEFTTAGLVAEHVLAWPANPPADALLIIAPESAVPIAQAVAAAQRGARVFYLGNSDGENPVLPLKRIKNFFAPESLPTNPVFAGLSFSDLRLRTERDWRVFAPGNGVEADGLLFANSVGPGMVVAAQLMPGLLDTEEVPAFRFTRWRQTRAITQILANLGATFAADARIFNPSIQRLSLAGDWKFQLTAPLPLRDWRKQEQSYKDPGISPAATAAVASNFNDSTWTLAKIPGFHPSLNEQSGEFVARRIVNIPPEWNNQVLSLGTGRIKSSDTVFWNGQRIGSTDNEWNKPRLYRLPAHLVKAGPNVLAIRGFSPDYQGGIHGTSDELFLRPFDAKQQPAALYHADYREDFDYGDEPARYYRW
jgi:beta-galactosidase